MSEALKLILYLCCMVANTTFCFFLFWTINLFLLRQRSMLQAVDIHLALKLIALRVSFLVMMRGNPPYSPLLEHPPAMAVMSDCSGHISPFISPGTEMDVGQALQPGETPLCAAQNTCPAVRWHPQFLPGQGGVSSLYDAFTRPPSPGTLGGARRGEDLCSLRYLPPRTTFLNQKSNYKLLTRKKTGY